MDPAFPDVVGESARAQIEDGARVWIVERGFNGRLEERVDPEFLGLLEGSEDVDEILEGLIIAAAEEDIQQTRLW